MECDFPINSRICKEVFVKNDVYLYEDQCLKYGTVVSNFSRKGSKYIIVEWDDTLEAETVLGSDIEIVLADEGVKD